MSERQRRRRRKSLVRVTDCLVTLLRFLYWISLTVMLAVSGQKHAHQRPNGLYGLCGRKATIEEDRCKRPLWYWLSMTSARLNGREKQLLSHLASRLNWGAGTAQSVVKRQTRDRKVAGSSPSRSGGRIFLSRVNFLCWLLFRYPYHPRVTTVAHKRSRSFCQMGKGDRLQLNTHAPYICGVEWSDIVNWCMVVWYTQNVRRDASSFTWHQPCNNQTALCVLHFSGYSKRAMKGYSHSFRIT